MDMLTKLRQRLISHKNAQAAATVINDPNLSFSEKLTQVQALESQASGDELELFDNIYSSLNLIAKTQDDFDLISGKFDSVSDKFSGK